MHHLPLLKIQGQQTITVQPGTPTQQGIGATPQVIQLQPTQMVNNLPPPPGGIQIVQQIVGPNGEIQQFPIQLTSQQMQLIRTQMTGSYHLLCIMNYMFTSYLLEQDLNKLL